MAFSLISSARLRLASLVFVLVALFSPAIVLGADSCTCFCGNDATGARDEGKKASNEECATACQREKDLFVGCFEEEALFPVHDDRCWTEKECTDWRSSDSPPLSATWGGVTARCSSTKSGETMGYCYGPSRTFKLNVPIAGVTEVGSLPDYIGIVYRFLLPAGALMAVSMIVLGGFQYIVSRGSKDAVGKAKKRIENAVVGLVLLLFAYVLAYLLDPRAVQFSAIKVPMMKEVVMLDSQSSCEALEDLKIDIQAQGDDVCGEKGVVTSVENMEANVAVGTWKEGDECFYQTCKDKGAVCAGDGESYQCVTCLDVPQPNTDSCKKAESVPKGWTGEYQRYCRYESRLNTCMTIDDGSSKGFSCANIQLHSITNKTGCAEYDTLGLEGKDGGISFDESSSGANLLGDICESDPCDVAAKAGVSGCFFEEGKCTNIP